MLPGGLGVGIAWHVIDPRNILSGGQAQLRGYMSHLARLGICRHDPAKLQKGLWNYPVFIVFSGLYKSFQFCINISGFLFMGLFSHNILALFLICEKIALGSFGLRGT